VSANDERKQGVLHDLRNVLAGAARLAELALERLERGHAARADVEALRDACLQGADLARELTGGAPAGTADLNELAARQLDLLRRTHGDAVRMRLKAPGEPLRVAMAAPDVQRMLDNLLRNAVEAMPGGGELVVTVARAPDGPEPRALLEIRDQGAGMDARTLARVFDPGFTTRKGPGRGLGLKVVKNLVGAANGSVHIVSEEGRGTAVRVRLPLAAEEEAPRAREAAKGGTILVVDDHAAVRSSVRQVLSESGYRVLEASDGQAALRLLGPEVDLLLTDLKLPDMDGAELAAQATARLPGLKVAFMSGYAWASPGAELLVKPAAPQELRDRIGALLGK
jgi:CheY-like chemotaxis protein/anti-sigma regulatory factor (Ser/Thr protein kinase)